MNSMIWILAAHLPWLIRTRFWVLENSTDNSRKQIFSDILGTSLCLSRNCLLYVLIRILLSVIKIFKVTSSDWKYAKEVRENIWQFHHCTRYLYQTSLSFSKRYNALGHLSKSCFCLALYTEVNLQIFAKLFVVPIHKKFYSSHCFFKKIKYLHFFP